MADNQGPNPGGSGPSKSDPLIPQHKRMAMGSPPKPESAPTQGK